MIAGRTAMLAMFTPKEHLACPTKRCQDGVIAYKIAAHAARPGERPSRRAGRDNAISKRGLSSAGKISQPALDPETAASSMMRLCLRRGRSRHFCSIAALTSAR